MLNKVVFDDEITLYWEKEWDLSDDTRYAIFVNGERIAITDKTHFELRSLNEDTEYAISLQRLGSADHIEETLFTGIIRTKKTRKRLDITKAPYFAVGDGKTLNTAVLQKAFDDCKEDECIYFPQGTYLTGALDVKSETEIYLCQGAILQGSTNITDYEPRKLTRFEGVELETYRALLNIGELNRAVEYNRKNIVIRGGGIICGGGEDLCRSTILSEADKLSEECICDVKNMPISAFAKKRQKEIDEIGRVRSKLIGVHNAQNVVFANVTFQYGASWTVHMVYSKNILTYGCSFFTQGVWNGDGWDPDSSENCTIFGCHFKTHDDAIAIKSGKNLEGSLIGRPTRNVQIFDCIGTIGVALGSELSGGISNVRIWDCQFTGGRAGFRIKTTEKRGGYVRDIKVRNCVFSDINISTAYPINDDGKSSKALTQIKDIEFESVEIQGYCISLKNTTDFSEKTHIFVYGFEQNANAVQNIHFKKLILHKLKDSSIQPIRINNASAVTMENVDFI